MKLISANTGLPREITWKDQIVTTGIFKEPVAGRIALRRLNLDGDQQADLSVHGGPDKAVYIYPREHYGFWRNELSGVDWQWGMFGENFTTEGLLENTVHIGDQYRLGSALVTVTQPRMPCYKLAAKFQRDDIIKRFLASGRTGFYVSVLQEGEVGGGDDIERIKQDEHHVAISDIIRLYAQDKNDAKMLRRVIALPALPESWRSYFAHRLEKLG